MNGDPIKSGDLTIGWITRTGCDNYWTLAAFQPGNDYEHFRELLEATLAEEDELQIALNRVNGLSLTIGNPPLPIRDFQMTSLDTVEFKEGQWLQQ